MRQGKAQKMDLSCSFGIDEHHSTDADLHPNQHLLKYRGRFSRTNISCLDINNTSKFLRRLHASPFRVQSLAQSHSLPFQIKRILPSTFPTFFLQHRQNGWEAVNFDDAVLCEKNDTGLSSEVVDITCGIAEWQHLLTHPSSS